MNLNDLFPGKFLKAHDLQGREPVVTIARVELEPMGRTRELKGVVYFKGKTKGLKLNKTNAQTIGQLTGSQNTDAWVGRQVQLYATTADFGGQTYDVIRIKAPGMAKAIPPPVVIAPPRMVADPVTIDILDSEIPF